MSNAFGAYKKLYGDHFIRKETQMKVTLRWNYTKSKLPSVLFTSEEMDSETAVQIAADLEKIGRAKEMIFIDEIGQEWTKKQFLKL